MSGIFTVLGSGSSGNCSYLEVGETRLLIDAGLSGLQIRKRLASIGRSTESLTGILITHEHSDHSQGLSSLCRYLNAPVYCNRLTREALETRLKNQPQFRIFTTGSRFDLEDVSVDNFSIPHDANDPVGFMLETECGRFGFLTDLGHTNRMVVDRIRKADVLLLESNYDLRLLQEDTRRPWSLKQRIISRHGHLSNDDAADLVEQIAGEGLKNLYLGHLSRDCNRPELAEKAVYNRLKKLGINHVQLTTATQDQPTETLTLNAAR